MRSVCVNCGHIIIWTGSVWKSTETSFSPESCPDSRTREHKPGPTIQETIMAVYGKCTHCGSVEVELNNQTGTQDLSDIGESSSYPTGYGCEVCD